MDCFVKFVREHKILLLFSILVTTVTYVLYLINAEDILTDSETYIVCLPDTLTVFERTGRFGLFVTKKIFSTDSYIPAVFLCYMMITMTLTAVVFDFAVLRIVDSRHQKMLEPFFFVFNGLFISCPVLVHQFYFYYQAFEVAFAFLLGILAASQVYAWVCREGGILPLLGGLICMIWSFSTYQTMVPFYIAVNAVFFFFLYLYGEKRSSYFRDCLKLVLVFAAGLVGYLVSGKLWLVLRHYPGATALSDSYLGWGGVFSGSVSGTDLYRFEAGVCP